MSSDISAVRPASRRIIPALIPHAVGLWNIWGCVDLQRVFLEVSAMMSLRDAPADPEQRRDYVEHKIIGRCFGRFKLTPSPRDIRIIIANPASSEGVASRNCINPRVSSHRLVPFAHQISRDGECDLRRVLSSRDGEDARAIFPDVAPECLPAYGELLAHMEGADGQAPCMHCRIVVEVHRAQLRARTARGYSFYSCDFGALE